MIIPLIQNNTFYCFEPNCVPISDTLITEAIKPYNPLSCSLENPSKRDRRIDCSKYLEDCQCWCGTRQGKYFERPVQARNKRRSNRPKSMKSYNWCSNTQIRAQKVFCPWHYCCKAAFNQTVNWANFNFWPSSIIYWCKWSLPTKQRLVTTKFICEAAKRIWSPFQYTSQIAQTTVRTLWKWSVLGTYIPKTHNRRTGNEEPYIRQSLTLLIFRRKTYRPM